MKERNDRMEAHLLDPAILVNASTRGHGSWTVALQPGLGDHFPIPCSPPACMPDDASIAAFGRDFAVAKYFLSE
jgi:hypothetical protein